MPMSSIVCERNGNTVYVRDQRGNTIDCLSFQHDVGEVSSFGHGLTVRSGGVCYSYELQNGYLKPTGTFASSIDERRASSASSASSGNGFRRNDATNQLQRAFRKYQLLEKIKEAERDEREDRILDALERTQAENARLKRDFKDLQEKQRRAEIARAKIDAAALGRKCGIETGKRGGLCRPKRDIPFSSIADLGDEVVDAAVEGYRIGYTEGIKLCALNKDEVSKIHRKELEEEKLEKDLAEKAVLAEEKRKREKKQQAAVVAKREQHRQELRKQSAEYRRRKEYRLKLKRLIIALAILGGVSGIVVLFHL